jgi:hypothetical protein
MGEPATSAASPTVSDIIPIAHARVNGWAGWRTLEYHDPAEELAFVAKDFKGMLRYHVGVHWYERANARPPPTNRAMVH